MDLLSRNGYLMNNMQFRYVFGPLSSWRLGRSLGIDPISQADKICNYDCIYCQLGPTKIKTNNRQIFVKTEDILTELKNFPKIDVDYYTISSRGEPTLALNLKDIISGVKKIVDGKVAVITNCALLCDEDVKEALMDADYLDVKFDVCSDDSLNKINRPVVDLNFDSIVDELKNFKYYFNGILSVQVMLTTQNIGYVSDIAEKIKYVMPDIVHLNTPTRECGVEALSKDEIEAVRKKFNYTKVKSVFDKDIIKTEAFSQESTDLRHGKKR